MPQLHSLPRFSSPTMVDCEDALPPKPEFISADLDYITDDLRSRAESELFEDEETKVRSLKELRDILKNESDLCWQDDDLFLLAFLRARKYDVKRAFTLVKGFYSCLGKHGNVFYNMNLEYLKRIMEGNCQCVLPYRDSKGSVIVCIRYSTWDPDVFTAEEMMSCLVLGIIQALTSPSTQIAGFQFIIDFKGLNWKHLVHSRPSDLLFIAGVFQSTVPIRVKGIHAVNQTSLFNYLWKMIKHFMSKKIRDRLHFHGSDMKSLHKFIHPSVLPANLGGELPELDNTEWRQKMEASADYVLRVLSFGYRKFLKKNWRRKSEINIESSS